MEEPKTLGIPPASGGALRTLQFARDNEPDDFEYAKTEHAASVICTYQPPTKEAIEAHAEIAAATARFLCAIVSHCPPGPERSTAISRAREARMWANAGIALEGK